MKSFPWTSTADGLGGDGFPNYDRASTAEDLQEIYSKFFTNGVYADPGDTFAVVAVSGMGVNVKPGGCLINGTFGIELEERPLVIQASDPSNPRKDTVVLRWNKNVEARSIDLYVVQGAPADDPQRPALTRNESVYEIGIADVLIPAGASSIQQQYIADTRPDESRCGYVTPLMEFDATGLYEQIQAQVDANLELIQAAIDGTLAVQLTERVETLETEVQPVERGGTGATSAAAARNALGLGNTTGALPIKNGGTGATSATSALNNLGIKKWLLDNVFKVGHVWISYTDTSPSGLVGGTWTPIKGRFPYFNAGTLTGGSNSHTLSVDEMPSHSHRAVNTFMANTAGSVAAEHATAWAKHSPNVYLETVAVGGGKAHNNMPAYQTLYAWRRTA